MSSEPWAGSTVESWLENVVESSKAEYPEEVVENLIQLLLSDSSDVNIRSKLINLLGPLVKTPVDVFLDWRDQIIKYFHQKYQNSSQTKQESKPNLAPIKRTKPIKPVVKAVYKNTESINSSRYDVQATTLEKPKIDRKQLSDLPEWVQQCFNGCKEFNDIQSQIFDTGYNTDDNMLVCAPTGAGKTNVAMITILHEIKKHIIEIPGIPPHIDDSPFLIVYITPMKALAMEIQGKLSSALKHLKVVVEEYTGDTSLTSAQVEKSHILVATPEKWDIATRRAGENAPSMRLKLLIIDEIHLLADDRGPVIESLVARTLRQVEQTQKQIRILGLSATLPNYTDVANFIRVPDNGLFYFGPEYRPVPLAMTLIGAKKTDKCPDQESQKLYNELKQPGFKDDAIQVDVLGIQVLKEIIAKGSQTIVFVHSRNETSKYAHIVNRYLGTSATDDLLNQASKKNLSPQLRETIALGIGIHHAGLPRQDRVFVEQMFRSNMFQILISTSTLAWGVNLPAHSVVIKGTKIYNTELGKIEDIGILDVHQMFGRAGRPQFDTCGEAYLITESKILSNYTKTLVNTEPIESKFMNKLEDFLNAEVSLGTVASKEDAIRWATYTFMYQLEPNYERTVDSIRRAIKNLTKYGMVKYSQTTEILHPTHVGLVSSMHYIPFDAVRFLNENLKGEMEESELIDCVFASGICDTITVRKNEYKEMEVYKPVIPFASSIEEVSGKVNFLLQTYISREPLRTTTLQLDQGWVTDNISRIFDAIYEISVEKGWCFLASFCLDLCKMVQRRMWWCRMRTDCPLIQIMSFPRDDQLLKRITRQGLSIDDIKQIDFKELGNLLRGDNYAAQALDLAKKFPCVRMSCSYQPVSDKYLNIVINVTFPFEWDYNICSQFMNYKLFIEDGDENVFYIASDFSVDEILAKSGMQLNYCVPIALGSKSYIISITSSEYLAAGDRCTLKIERIGKLYEPYKSALVPLMALPIAALNNIDYMKFFGFKFFNEIQTQLFYQVYHTNENILLCAPNGTGKSVIGELAILKQLLEKDDSKILYLNPLQISLDEKVSNWKEKLPEKFCCLTGDFSNDCSLIQKNRIIASNPEDFDNLSKVKSMKIFLSRFKLIVIDDVHMMNNKKGALIEVIVDRMRKYCRKLRFVVIGNTVANPIDLSVYFEVELRQTFNFPLEARPVEMKFLLRGFPGRNYSARMAAMNKPLSDSIKSFSEELPTIIFVSSRKQTKLTASELIDYANNRGEPDYYKTKESTQMSEKVDNEELKYFLSYGIGIHHNSLTDKDKKIVEGLFRRGQLRLLIAPVSFAWGKFIPAKFVVIKGTEYFDTKTNQYVPYPIQDMQQMMARAGRPYLDQEGLLMIYCEESRKEFLQNFVYSPVPIESSLPSILLEVINAEVSSRNIRSLDGIMSFLHRSYLFIRINHNPKYYTKNLEEIAQETVDRLLRYQCITVNNDGRLKSTQLGKIAALYSVAPSIVYKFSQKTTDAMSIDLLLRNICSTADLSEIPLRYNEDRILSEMTPRYEYHEPLTSSAAKAFFILNYYFSNRRMPNQDFESDKTVILKQTLKIAKCFCEICCIRGLALEALNCLAIVQMINFGLWFDSNPLLVLTNETFDFKFIHEVMFTKQRLPKILHELRNDFCLYKKARFIVDKSRTLIRIELEKVSGTPGSQIFNKNWENQNTMQALHVLVAGGKFGKLYCHDRVICDKENLIVEMASLSIIPKSDIWVYLIPEGMVGMDQMIPLVPMELDHLRKVTKESLHISKPPAPVKIRPPPRKPVEQKKKDEDIDYGVNELEFNEANVFDEYVKKEDRLFGRRQQKDEQSMPEYTFDKNGRRRRVQQDEPATEQFTFDKYGRRKRVQQDQPVSGNSRFIRDLTPEEMVKFSGFNSKMRKKQQPEEPVLNQDQKQNEVHKEEEAFYEEEEIYVMEEDNHEVLENEVDDLNIADENIEENKVEEKEKQIETDEEKKVEEVHEELNKENIEINEEEKLIKSVENTKAEENEEEVKEQIEIEEEKIDEKKDIENKEENKVVDEAVKEETQNESIEKEAQEEQKVSEEKLNEEVREEIKDLETKEEVKVEEEEVKEEIQTEKEEKSEIKEDVSTKEEIEKLQTREVVLETEIKADNQTIDEIKEDSVSKEEPKETIETKEINYEEKVEIPEEETISIEPEKSESIEIPTEETIIETSKEENKEEQSTDKIELDEVPEEKEDKEEFKEEEIEEEEIDIDLLTSLANQVAGMNDLDDDSLSDFLDDEDEIPKPNKSSKFETYDDFIKKQKLEMDLNSELPKNQINEIKIDSDNEILPPKIEQKIEFHDEISQIQNKEETKIDSDIELPEKETKKEQEIEPDVEIIPPQLQEETNKQDKENEIQLKETNKEEVPKQEKENEIQMNNISIQNEETNFESDDDYNIDDDEKSEDIYDEEQVSKPLVEEEKKEEQPILELKEVPSIQQISKDQNIPLEVETIDAKGKQEQEYDEEEDYYYDDEEEDYYEYYDEEEEIIEKSLKKDLQKQEEKEEKSPKLNIENLKTEITKIKESHQKTLTMQNPRTSTLVVVNNDDQNNLVEEIPKKAVIVEIKNKPLEITVPVPPKKEEPPVKIDVEKPKDQILHQTPLKTQSKSEVAKSKKKRQQRPALLISHDPDDPNYDPIEFLKTLDTKPLSNKPPKTASRRKHVDKPVEILQDELIQKGKMRVRKQKIIIKLGSKAQIPLPEVAEKIHERRKRRSKFVTRSGQRIQRSRNVSHSQDRFEEEIEQIEEPIVNETQETKQLEETNPQNIVQTEEKEIKQSKKKKDDKFAVYRPNNQEKSVKEKEEKSPPQKKKKENKFAVYRPQQQKTDETPQKQEEKKQISEEKTQQKSEEVDEYYNLICETNWEDDTAEIYLSHFRRPYRTRPRGGKH